MDKPKIVIKFMNENLYLIENETQYENVNKNVLRTALAYKYLLNVYMNIQNVTIHQILIDNDYDLGLIGSLHGCIVSICEKICGNRICHLHSILHDTYGRIFLLYGVGRGYKYMFDAPNCMKSHHFAAISPDYYTVYTVTLDITLHIKINIMYYIQPLGIIFIHFSNIIIHFNILTAFIS